MADRTFEQAFDRTRSNIDLRMAATEFAIQNYAKRAEQHMKSRRPWRDRTGEARRQLTASASSSWQGIGGERELRVEFRLAHGVPYGEHLEYGMGGRYAILRPTAELFSVRMWRRLRAIWSGTSLDLASSALIETAFES